MAENRDHYKVQSKKDMVDFENKNRLEGALLTDALPKHVKGHDKHHLETTYVKDYTHPYPELLGQKSIKTVRNSFYLNLFFLLHLWRKNEIKINFLSLTVENNDQVRSS